MGTDFKREDEMLDPLLAWLGATGRLGEQPILKEQFAWYGRRVDLAVLLKSGATAAYELKLSKLSRAIEQAGYNRLAFDRSYIVTATVPSSSALAEAAAIGVGVIRLERSSAKVLVRSPVQSVDPLLRRRLRYQMRAGVVDLV